MRQTLFVNSLEPKPVFNPITDKVKDLSDLAKKIIERADIKDFIIFIDVYLEVAGFDIDEMKGVELLKWLRLEGITNHIVLYGSVLSAEELIRFDPTYAIVASQGTTVIQDYDFDNTKIEYNVLFPENAKEYLTPFIKAEFTMPEDERHNWANWWGIKKLYDVHENWKPNIIYPDTIQEKLKELSSEQALFLYDPKDKLAPDCNPKADSIYDDYKQKHTDLISRAKKILYIDDQADEGWAEIFYMMFFNKTYDAQIEDPDFVVYRPKLTDDIVNEAKTKIESLKPDLVLLDLRLKKENGVRINVRELSGAIVLEEIRKEHLGLPVIMVTASNKARSIEQLEKLGCNAFWIKEGLDSKMSITDSIDNYYNLIHLVESTTGEEYQFLKRLGEKVKELEDVNNSYWWENHIWERKEGVLIFDKEGSGKITLNPDNGSTLKVNNSQFSITDWGMGRKTVNYKNKDYNFKIYHYNSVYKVILWSDFVKVNYTICYLKSDLLNHFFTVIDLFKRLFKSEILYLKNSAIYEIHFLTNSILVEVGKIIEEFHREPIDKYFDNKICSGTWFGIDNTKDMYSNEGDFFGSCLYFVRNSISHRTTKADAQINLTISDLILYYSTFSIWVSEKVFPQIDPTKIKQWKTDIDFNLSINQLKSIVRLEPYLLTKVQNLLGKQI